MEIFILKQEINIFQKLSKATYGEMLHLCQKILFKPIKVDGLNPIEIKRAL